MKIREIITEDVDMSWWQDIDAQYNPEALKQIHRQEQRAEMIKQDAGGTPIFTKPVRQSEDKFTNIPADDIPPSAGYVGHLEVQVRAKHISKAEGKSKAGFTLPRSPRLPL